MILLPPKKKSLVLPVDTPPDKLLFFVFGWFFLPCQQIWITKVVSTFSRALNLLSEGRLAVSFLFLFFPVLFFDCSWMVEEISPLCVRDGGASTCLSAECFFFPASSF
jgi:hypothetical protein